MRPMTPPYVLSCLALVGCACEQPAIPFQLDVHFLDDEPWPADTYEIALTAEDEVARCVVTLPATVSDTGEPEPVGDCAPTWNALQLDGSGERVRAMNTTNFTPEVFELSVIGEATGEQTRQVFEPDYEKVKAGCAVGRIGAVEVSG